MLDNLPPDVTEATLLALFEELGIPRPVSIAIAPGVRNRPSAAIALEADHAEMEAIVHLLNGRVWQGHAMHASHASFFR